MVLTLQVITGYLLAGSLIGPGGFSFVSEMVQVCYFFTTFMFEHNITGSLLLSYCYETVIFFF